MGIISNLKANFFIHLLMGYVFVVSGLIVCFCMLLTWICVWPWNKTLYRKIVVNLAYGHWSRKNVTSTSYNSTQYCIFMRTNYFPTEFTFLAHWWSGSDTTLFFENPEDFQYVGREHHIVVANHKYDIDWMAMWMLAERTQLLGVSPNSPKLTQYITSCKYKFFHAGNKNLRKINPTLRASDWLGVVFYGKYFSQASMGH